VGYTGGDSPAPTYDSVCDGDGHTEAIRVVFDPTVLPYDTLLAHFFDVSGTRAFKARPKAQYKSAVWVVDETQRAIAEASIARLSAAIGDDGTVVTVVTEVLDFKSWADAEERHQNYMRKHRAAKAARAKDAARWVDAWGGREGGQ
jgi:peptide-methionine (S)-S-oxide reductase